MTRNDVEALIALISGALTALALVVMAILVVTSRTDGTDCLQSGYAVCVVDGVTVANLTDLPVDPYDRCLFLLSLSVQTGGIDMAAETCETIEENR